ncbi:hypothetical protein [Kibdelosporangium phytohabitans]|nr:hypothetical protein [Kibdelosporangium phytohabitans]MBE1464895.1 hypothetical protein [Kibdelosporangium phytohabitans]
MNGPTPEEKRIDGNELLVELRRMGLDPDHFVVFGSAPLLVHGLRETVSDLDVVARDWVWDYVSEHGEQGEGTRSKDRIWLFHGGRIQFSRNWIRFDEDEEHSAKLEWNTDDLIDSAEPVGGLRFARVEDVLAYKQRLLRPKDQIDIDNLREYIANRDS